MISNNKKSAENPQAFSTFLRNKVQAVGRLGDWEQQQQQQYYNSEYSRLNKELKIMRRMIKH